MAIPPLHPILKLSLAPKQARRGRAPVPSESLTPAQMLAITTAFDEAALPSPAPTKKQKKNHGKMVVLDDEDEEEQLEMVASTSSGGGGGGWVVDKMEVEGARGGGGFIPEDGAGGGFVPDDGDGGFLSGGGFLPELSPPAGGFFAEAGGGFIPDFPLPDLSHLPDLSPFENNNNNDAPPPDHIPLQSIPRALTALNLPAASHDLLSLFRDIAFQDEAGVDYVTRERFVEACTVLLAGDDDDDNDDSEEERGGSPSSEDEGEAYVQEGRARRGGTRRSTRANPVHDDKDDGRPGAMDLDLDALPSDEESASDSDVEILESSSSRKKGKGKAVNGKGKASTRGKKKDRERVLSKAELQEAEDTFELFFEGSLQTGSLRKKTIGLADLERVTRLLNEKMSEEEVSCRF